MLDKEIWIWLSLHFGAGTSIYQKLYSHFGNVQDIYNCDDSDADLISWLSSHQKKKLLDKNLDYAHEVMDWCDCYDVNIVTPSDEDYPLPLRALKNYPAALYYKGTLPDFGKELCVSVVGTRNNTVEGQRNAYNLGFGLAKGGAVVVSGMAKGIDSIAQKGALYAGGFSVAVLGCGIDVVYPRENAALMDKLMRVGAVMTEFPPKTPPNGSNFPIRNRIISALSQATVVVEADLNSGSLITARLALEQGKELFAFPGPVNSNFSKGTNRLLSDGAKVATEAIDVLEQFMDKFPKLNLFASKERPVITKSNKVAASNVDYGKFYSQLIPNENKSNTSANNDVKETFDVNLLNELEKKIYDAMEFNTPVSLDFFVKFDLEVSELASVLTVLEIKGALESIPGGYYIKK